MLILKLFKSLRNDSSSVASAFYSLVNKGVNSIIPIIFIPLINNLFGPESFGKMIYFQSLVGLILIFADYGFTVNGIKEAGDLSSNSKLMNKLYSEVLTIKSVFLIIGAIILNVYLILWNKNIENINDYFLFLFVLSSLAFQNLIPFWLFQGVKKNKSAVLINLFSKFLLLVLIILFLFFIKHKNIYQIALIECISYLIALILSTYVLIKKFNILFELPSFNNLKLQIIKGFDFFIIILCYWLINNGSIVYLEYMKVNLFEIGFFGIYLRFSYYVFAIFQPIIHSLIPFFADNFKKSFSSGIHFYNKTFLLFSITVFIILVSAGLLLDQITFLAFDHNIYQYYIQNKEIPYLLLVWTFFILINNFSANSVLLTNGDIKLYRNAQLINSLVAVAIFFLFGHKNHATAVCFGMIFGEVIFSIIIFNKTYKYTKIFLNDKA